MTDEIQLGDVALDKAQGRAVHILDVCDETVGEYTDYDLLENYANRRLGVTEDDAVYMCVYCNSVKSEPSITYAMPESRLVRVETEAADDGRRVAERVQLELLDEMFAVALAGGNQSLASKIEALAEDVVGEEIASEARELAQAGRFAAEGHLEDDPTYDR